ncbi:MAG: DUF1289 domain-containing protein [Lentisphaeria bacterium]|nr:DUF1289 domain-containing protein [Lentisphaeria bacterium]
MNSKEQVLKTNSSPCIQVCKLNKENLCIGCFRSIDEIAFWIDLSEEEQKEVVKQCQIRKETLRV